MPIFPRRHLQLMLDELAPWLSLAKAKDFVGRLESRDPDQAIPAEYEIGLIWHVSKLADLEIEKPLDSKAPDFFSKDLLKGRPAYFEIAALSDVALSGEVEMRRAANIINDFCNGVLPMSSKNLYYEFHGERGYENVKTARRTISKYFRRRRITKKFSLNDQFRGQLRDWLRGGFLGGKIDLQSDDIAVTITWRKHVHPHGNTFSSVPSEAHDLRNNPVYSVLNEKAAKQLRSTPPDVLRCIILCDAGCELLRRLRPMSYGGSTFSGEQIIRNFLKEGKVDIICVVSPQRRNPNSISPVQNERVWKSAVFGRDIELSERHERDLREFLERLPAPYLDGYQARSWHQQGFFDPQGRGHYVAPEWIGGNGRQRLRISARGLQEYLAGRLSRDNFKNWVCPEDLFERELLAGNTIADVRLERTGASADDDYIVLEFAPDPSAMPLRVPDANLQRDPD